MNLKNKIFTVIFAFIASIFVHNVSYALLPNGCPDPADYTHYAYISNGTRTTFKPVPCGTGSGAPIQCICDELSIGYDKYECNCNSGYEPVNQNTSSCSCAACPSNTYNFWGDLCTLCPNGTGTLTTANTSIEACLCNNNGYYYSGSICTRCPLAATNLSGGSVYGAPNKRIHKMSECYLPTGTYKNSVGTYKMTGDCFYE